MGELVLFDVLRTATAHYRLRCVRAGVRLWRGWSGLVGRFGRELAAEKSEFKGTRALRRGGVASYLYSRAWGPSSGCSFKEKALSRKDSTVTRSQHLSSALPPSLWLLASSTVYAQAITFSCVR